MRRLIKRYFLFVNNTGWEDKAVVDTDSVVLGLLAFPIYLIFSPFFIVLWALHKLSERIARWVEKDPE